MTRYIILLTLATAFFGCEKTIDINLMGEPPIVVNAFFNPDSSWAVRVERGGHGDEMITYADTILPDSIYGAIVRSAWKTIDDATVEITSGSGEHITLAHDSHGYYNYKSPMKPRAGESYSVSVQVPGQPLLLSSSVVLPNPVPIDTAYVSVLPNDELQITVEFTDVPGPTTYGIEFKTPAITWPFSVLCDDPDVYADAYYAGIDGTKENEVVVIEEAVLMSISDWNFQGQKKKLQFRKYNGALHKDWTVRMRTLSHELARYRTTAYLQLTTKSDPFAQPVQVFNNISNGVGIFAGYSTIDYHIDRE